ncbi:MAG: hypothetical protein EKK49_01295 [Rhodocyclaceae bacterium]|nr:MAG: hypothetical protein EKK49_01295 [Rhodocyclaceae bacterium]
MSPDLTFTASDRLYSLHSDVNSLTLTDQLSARLAQLSALLAMTRGEQGKAFRLMNAQWQDSFMWACGMMAMEAQELFGILSCPEARGRLESEDECHQGLSA